MAKYEKEVKELLEYVGGKENIASLMHCVTRLRFVLKDESKVDITKIEALPTVKGTFTQAGQFQVIIGNQVSEFYKEFAEYAGIQAVSKEEVKQAAKQNQNLAQRAVSNLAEIFAPLIPAIIVGGLLLGFRSVIGDIYMLNDGTATLKDVYPWCQGLYDFLWLICEAALHFLPIGVVWSITKKMKGTEILGIVTGVTLVSPQLINAYQVATAENIPIYDLGIFQIERIGYQSQIIPAILVGFTLVYLERFFRKITPQSIQMIVVPFGALVPTVFLAHAVLGPVGWQLGEWISQGVAWGFQSSVGWLFGGLYGLFYPVLVITGLHHTMLAIDLQLCADPVINGTYMWPILVLCNIAQGSACLGYILMNRKNEKDKQVAVPAVISAYLGVTEPAIFGINLKYVYPFIGGMLGSGIGGLFSMFFVCKASSVGVGGIPGILSMKIESIPMFAIAMVIALVLPVLFTMILSKTKLNKFGKA
ncbi:MAG: PTS system trehalose-specific EIIBC component [Acutalibacteraceae bacterium]|nr:PTS system trehalose-specific EIIBC component [Acutalibacteraceae bacterium]